MAVESPFALPDEVLISTLYAQYPCRERQIRSLTTLLSGCFKPPKNLVIYGLEATGKTSIIASLLSQLCSASEKTTGNGDGGDEKIQTNIKYALVNSAECITGRHLLETTVGAIAHAVCWKGTVSRCENLAQLAVEVGRLLEWSNGREDLSAGGANTETQFILVFDGIDCQRDAPPTLLPALARLSETVNNLTTIFVVKSPRPHFLHTPGVPHIHFPAYTKAEAIRIISRDAPPIYENPLEELSPEEAQKLEKETKEVWTRFCTAIWDTLSKHSGRDVLSFRAACTRLWPPFIVPLKDGTYSSKDFSRLLVAKRPLFQDESVLVPNITSSTSTTTTTETTARPDKILQHHHQPLGIGLATQLPTFSRLLLIAAYLASYTPPRNDALLYMKSALQKRRKRGGGTAKPRGARASKHRKISSKLLGPQSFVLERMLAIFHAVRIEAGKGADGGGGGSGGSGGGAMTADIPMAVATLASLRLVVRTSAVADVLDASTKWKVNVGWEVVRSVARSVGVEVEDFLLD